MWLRSRMVSGLQSWRSTAVERPQAFPSLINSSADSTGADVGAIVGKTAPSALSNAFIDTEHLLVDVTVVRVTGYAELSLWKRTIAQYFPHAIFFFMALGFFRSRLVLLGRHVISDPRVRFLDAHPLQLHLPAHPQVMLRAEVVLLSAAQRAAAQRPDRREERVLLRRQQAGLPQDRLLVVYRRVPGPAVVVGRRSRAGPQHEADQQERRGLHGGRIIGACVRIKAAPHPSLSPLVGRGWGRGGLHGIRREPASQRVLRDDRAREELEEVVRASSLGPDAG